MSGLRRICGKTGQTCLEIQADTNENTYGKSNTKYIQKTEISTALIIDLFRRAVYGKTE